MKFPKWKESDAEKTGDYRDDMSHTRFLASYIVGDIFEDFLERVNVTVPNKERDENGGDDPKNCLAILYGSLYEELTTTVEQAIEAYVSQINK